MFSLALTYFLIANPIGNSPTVLALVKDYDFKQQRSILFREAIFALLLALFFQYFGEMFLRFLHIEIYAVTITGGLLLLLVALSMIFPQIEAEAEGVQLKQQPFIVPIATPIISGPGLLATIMLTSKIEGNHFTISGAIIIAWIGIIAVMTCSPYLQKILGKRGLLALEQVMGMILALMSMQMLVKGIGFFIKELEPILKS